MLPIIAEYRLALSLKAREIRHFVTLVVTIGRRSCGNMLSCKVTHAPRKDRRCILLYFSEPGSRPDEGHAHEYESCIVYHGCEFSSAQRNPYAFAWVLARPRTSRLGCTGRFHPHHRRCQPPGVRCTTANHLYWYSLRFLPATHS